MWKPFLKNSQKTTGTVHTLVTGLANKRLVITWIHLASISEAEGMLYLVPSGGTPGEDTFESSFQVDSDRSLDRPCEIILEQGDVLAMELTSGASVNVYISGDEQSIT